MTESSPVRTPSLTIITVTLNDVWALSKTIKSVAMQEVDADYEYIIVDGDSQDNTDSLIQFWRDQGVISAYYSEADNGVYSAMNRGVSLAHGEYILFMNAGDVFFSSRDLGLVLERLRLSNADGLLGWGLLKEQIWASWHLSSDAVRMSSLGFCHQALYLKKAWLDRIPFVDTPGQTDSDTRQLADCIAAGANIILERSPLAIRSPSPGISANLELTKRSITRTLLDGYPELSEQDIANLISFRRGCECCEQVSQLLSSTENHISIPISLMVLDTLNLKQSSSLSEIQVSQLMDQAFSVIWRTNQPAELIGEMIDTLVKKRSMLNAFKIEKHKAEQKNQEFNQRLDSIRNSTQKIEINQTAPVVCLTTFPSRESGLSLVIRSLLNQTLPVQKVYLIVGKDEFKNQWQFPKELYELLGDAFEIVFVEQTKHQYDKFIHTTYLNKDAPLIIVDDDVVYPERALEALYNNHVNHPDAVIANRCHQITLDSAGNLLPYSDWKREVYSDQPRHDLFPTGAGGVLYPPGFFSDGIQEDLMLACCPYADDVWLKAISILKDMKVRATTEDPDAWKLGYASNVRDQPLHRGNVDFGLNDLQLRRMFNWLERQGVDWRGKLTEMGD